MKRRELALFVLLCSMWGFSFVALKVALRYADPIFLAALRFVPAAGLVMLWTAFLGRRVKPTRADLPTLVTLGILNTGLLAMLLSLGQREISAGLGAILLYTYPLMAAAVAALFLKERIDALKGAGLALGFAGIVLIAGFEGHASMQGILFVLGAAASWAAGTVFFKRTRGDRDIFFVSSWQLLFGGLFLLLASAIVERVPHIETRLVLLWACLWLAVPGMAFAGTLWFWLLDRGEAAVASAYMFMTPAFGVFFGAIVLGERVTWTTVVGGALVAVAIYLVNRRASREEEGQRPSSRDALPTTIRSRASSESPS